MDGDLWRERETLRRGPVPSKSVFTKLRLGPSLVNNANIAPVSRNPHAQDTPRAATVPNGTCNRIPDSSSVKPWNQMAVNHLDGLRAVQWVT